MNKKEYYSKNKIVESYDSERYGGKSGALVLKKELSIIKSLLPNKAYILDVACGTGRLTKIFSRNHRIVGIDYSKAMLDKAKQLKRYNKLVFADALNLPFKENSFDCIINIRFLFHYEDIFNFLREFRRVVKKNGFIIFQTYRWSPKMFFNIKALGGKIYIHSDRKINGILKKLDLKLIKKEASFLFSPYIYKTLPLFIVCFLFKLENFIPSKFKVDVYWKVKKL